MEIRPISDLRNNFSEIENLVSTGDPVFLTKNGRGAMVVMSMERFNQMNADMEHLLNEADMQASILNASFSHK
ncbi:MAG: type II toxin-antitoxin system Phd/YefM family antitoxin [Eggerthellaceae bacterium]|nr:type II toxin-antitoxin system Phd/YefM family antitoxin [Eggerthellaceae bacterium]